MLGIRGAKISLQSKGEAGAGRISHIADTEVEPPPQVIHGTIADTQREREIPLTNATFTKSSPQIILETELNRHISLDQPTETPPPCPPEKTVEASRGRGQSRDRRPGVTKIPRPGKPGGGGNVVKSASRGSGIRSVGMRGRGKVTSSGAGRGSSATGGRRELQKIIHSRKRALFLCKKYGWLWVRKVFGRVKPSEARRHNQRKLKKQCFVIWCQQWWSTRREWKLNIRADCHNRYRLWMLIWKHWTEFVNLRKQKKTIKQSAINHNERRLMKKIWQAWCEFHRQRRKRLQWRETAQQWHQTTTLRRGWMMWRDRLEKKQGRDIMLSSAIHHWNTTLQTQVWLCWKKEYHERVALRERMCLADHHWKMRQRTNHWRLWTTYIHCRRRKIHMKRVATRRYRWCVLRTHFRVWQERLEREREFAEFQQCVVERGRRAVLRRSLSLWRHYIELVLYKEHLTSLTTCHYHNALKNKAVVSFRIYCERQKLQKQQKAIAENLHRQMVLSNSWRVWLQRCEHCEEIKMLPLTRRARHHFRLCFLRQYLPAWKTFVLLNQQKKSQKILADQHFKSVTLPRCFVILREYAVARRYKAELLSHAQSFRRETLLSMVFYKWWRALCVSQNNHELEGVAVKHCEKKRKLFGLTRWREQTRFKILYQQLQESAVVHYERWLLSLALRKWRTHRQHRVMAAEHSVLATNHHTIHSMRIVWTAWSEFVEKKREKKTRYKYGLTHYNVSLMNRVLIGWKVYHSHVKRKRRKRVKSDQHYNLSLKRCVLKQWRENVEWQRYQQHMESVALVHFKKTLYLKFFSHWRVQTLLNLDAAQRERERLQDITSTLIKRKLVRVLASWKEFTNSQVARRIVHQRAVHHSNCHLLRTCLSAWQSYHTLILRKMVLARQSSHFHRNLLVTSYYAKWRVKLMETIVMKQKSVIALWHWSQCLQRKTMVSWLVYNVNRKRKAERYALALQGHRDRLLHIGVRQWIEFASSMQAQRVDSALQHQTQASQRVVQCVRRCAQKWRNVVKRGGHSVPLAEESTTGGGLPSSHQQPAEDIWTVIARKHQITELSSSKRPQPRQPNYLQSKVAHGSELLPRSIIPHPASPPLQYGRPPLQRAPVGNNDRRGVVTTLTFDFHPSTVSLSSVNPGNVSSLPQSVGYSGPVETVQHNVLLPPSAFDRPTDEDRREGRGVGLTDPAMRSRIVHVRDELKRYHQMKMRQRMLEDQVANTGDNNPQLTELQDELERTVAELQRTGPILQEMVTQIQHLLSQT